jgi:hypothetical protein
MQNGTQTEYTFRKFQNGDQAALEKLLKSVFPRFNDENIWVWKYKLNPSFDNSLVTLAFKDHELIGCNYWMQRDLKLKGDLQVNAALGADVAVNPHYRKFGVGKGLLRYPRISGVFKEKNMLLSYMFGRPELNTRFYKLGAGYIVAPNHTITYRKLFNVRQLKEKFDQINRKINSNVNLKKALKELTMSISFKLRGTPEFTVHFGPEKIYIEEGEVKGSNMIIEGNLPLSILTIGSEVGLGDLFKLFLTGRVKIKRGFFRVFKMRRIFILLRKALNENSQN